MDQMPARWKRALGRKPLHQAWVAEIVGKRRRFLGYKITSGPEQHSKDVFRVYLLEAGRVYEVSAPLDWKCCDRYFCTVTMDGQIRRLTREEVDAWMPESEGQRPTSGSTC